MEANYEEIIEEQEIIGVTEQVDYTEQLNIIINNQKIDVVVNILILGFLLGALSVYALLKGVFKSD